MQSPSFQPNLFNYNITPITNTSTINATTSTITNETNSNMTCYGIMTSRGCLGIGTAVPNMPLHVVGNSFFNNYVGVGTTVSMQALHVQGNSCTSGSVGIGTTLPLYAQHVVGSQYITGNSTVLGNQYVSGTVTTTNTAVQISEQLVVQNMGTGPAFIVSQQESSAQPIMQVISGSTSNLVYITGGSIGIGTLVPAATFHSYNNSVFSGSVGVGTTLPQYDLDVAGGTVRAATFIGSAASLTGISSAIASLSLTSNICTTSNVGIGTTNPKSALSVVGGIAIGNYALWGSNIPSGTLAVNGSVGVGTTTPTSALQVVGNAIVNGSIGIGTALPLQPFHVNGAIYASGSIGIGTPNPANALQVYGNAVLSGGLLNVLGTTPIQTNGVAIGSTVAGIVSYSSTVGGGTVSQIGYITLSAGTWIVTGYNLGLQCPVAGTVQWVSFNTSIGTSNSAVATPNTSMGGTTTANGAFTLYATTCVVLSPSTSTTYYWMCVCNNQTNVTGFTWNVNNGQLSAIKIA